MSILVFGVVYIFHSWSVAHKGRTALHQQLVQLERQDRNFLLRAIYNFSKNEEAKLDSEKGYILDQNQIFRIKFRFIAALIGKLYLLFLL